MRRRALELRAAEQSNTIPENTTPLTALEEEILSIIGQGALDSIIIKTDPLADAVGIALVTYFKKFFFQFIYFSLLQSMLRIFGLRAVLPCLYFNTG